MSMASSDIDKAPSPPYLPDSKAPYGDEEKALDDHVELASYSNGEEDPDNVTKDIKVPDNAFGRFLSKAAHYNRKLEALFGIEARGIQRVKPEERNDPNIHGNMMVWLAANCCLPTFSIGVLGPLAFGLHLGDALLTIACFCLFAGCCPAFCATFGPSLGLRQMTSSRYSWGYWGSKWVALLNCIACIGWSISNTIAGAQALSAVDNFHLPAAVGVVIIAMITLFVGLFGYRIVHWYEKLAWFPTAVTFIVMLGVAAKHFVSEPMHVGTAEAASVLSFGGTIWGFVIGWVSLASDYNVYMPQDTPKKKVFFYTYAGVVTPCILIMWLGSAVASAALSASDGNGKILPNADPTLARWFNAYSEHELGGLLYEVLVGPMKGGGKFFMVLLVLSVVANNIVNVYSMGLSVSVISHYLAAMPRLIWPCFVTAIYIPLAIVGYTHFAETLSDFMSILGYWLAIFVTVLFEEHFIFRKCSFDNYKVANTWNNRKRLPAGWGALGAFCFGAAGVALGMSQTWYTGRIAQTFGGDIGFELASGFAGLAYPVFRSLEIKFLGR